MVYNNQRYSIANHNEIPTFKSKKKFKEHGYVKSTIIGEKYEREV